MSCGELLSRHHPQTSSPDIVHNFLKTTGSDGIFHRFCLRHSVRSGSEYFVFTPCGQSNEPGESLWQPWSTSQSSEHSENPLPTELPHGFLCFVPKGSPNPPYLNWPFQTAAKFQSWELHEEPGLLWLALCLH